MEIVESEVVSFVRDGVLMVAYRFTHWVECGDALMLTEEVGEYVLPLSCPYEVR